jgi:hypothetical protein
MEQNLDEGLTYKDHEKEDGKMVIKLLAFILLGNTGNVLLRLKKANKSIINKAFESSCNILSISD